MLKLPLPGAKEGAIAQEDRLAAMILPREEYGKLVDVRLLQIIQDAQEPTTVPDLTYGEIFFVYRITKKRWDGLYCYVGDNGAVFFILMENGDIDRFQKPAVKIFAVVLELDTLSTPASTLRNP